MPGSVTFREKIVEAQEAPEVSAPLKPLPNDNTDGATPAIEESDEPKETVSALETWEETNGIKYGVELFGIKDVMTDFSLKMDYSVVDKYIRDEIKENGYDATPKKWQEILDGLELEIGSSKLDAFERLKKLSSYIKVLKKYKEIKEKKEQFRI